MVVRMEGRLVIECRILLRIELSRPARHEYRSDSSKSNARTQSLSYNPLLGDITEKAPGLAVE